MKKTVLLTLLCLVTNFSMAQKPQSFAEYWFGIKPSTQLSTNKKNPTPSFTPTSVGRKQQAPAEGQNGIITLDLTLPRNPQSFTLTEKKYWTETYNDVGYTFIEANTPFSFSHLLGGAGASWGGIYWDGFTYSKNGDNSNYGNGGSQGWVANQWGNMAGGGIKTDPQGNVMKDENGVVMTDKETPYLLAYWGYAMEPEYFYTIYTGDNITKPTHNLQVLFTDKNSYQAVGVYINNHPWPYYGNISGDGFARSFREGDYFKLFIHGLDSDGNETGKSVEHILAEYKDGQLHQSANWEWVDLSSLGEIGGLYYTLKTTDENPIYGPNTAVYFCMDKLQIRTIPRYDVTVNMNETTSKMVLRKKETGEAIETGDPLENQYTFKASPGEYLLYGYQNDETTLNGTIELTITNDSTQTFQLHTMTTWAINSEWELGSDYTIVPTVSSPQGNQRMVTPVVANGTSTFLAYAGDSYQVRFIPSEAKQMDDYITATASGVVTENRDLFRILRKGYKYNITAPSEATVFVGIPSYSGYYYRPFTEVEYSLVTNSDSTKTYTYSIPNNQECIYRISQSGKTTYASVFTKTASSESITITEDMLEGDPKTIDYDVNSNNGFNVADIYLNINEKGHLPLLTGQSHQIVNLRAWQTVNTVTANLFIEPDYHYTVLNENGEEDTSVVTVNEKGLLKAVGSGTAIVLVSYDAIQVKSGRGGPFFGALWPENCGVFVVTVDATESGIMPNMTVNETLNATSDKMAGIHVDAELDVFYYLKEEGAYRYTFSPKGVSSVTLAQPIVGDHITTYNGFGTEGVTDNGDGSYTVELIHGRNIVKLSSAQGVSYQVLTAKPITYSITNNSNEGQQPQPGDEITIRFNTLYHPATKLAGIYNMNAYVVYTANDTTLVNRGSQYFFASSDNGQNLVVTIPSKWNTAHDFVLNKGVLRAGGKTGLNYGDPFGNHRTVTLERGAEPNFSAVRRMAYFGALPDVHIEFGQTTGVADNSVISSIRAYPNPFVDYLIIETQEVQNAKLYSSTGHLLLEKTMNEGKNRIHTSTLPKGIYLLKIGNTTLRVIK